MLMIVVSFLKYVDEIMLDRVKAERYNLVSILDIVDIILVNSPICEVELLTELTESFTCLSDCGFVEDSEWGLAF